MPDLREIYGKDYYKDIRKKRVTPSKGYIQTLTDEEKKVLSQKGHAARWKKDTKHASKAKTDQQPSGKDVAS